MLQHAKRQVQLFEMRCYKMFITALCVVQSLNSPFFPPHIGAEPGRAKRRVQDNLHAHARNAAIFPPEWGEKPYLEARFRFGLLCDFLNNNIQAPIFAF